MAIIQSILVGKGRGKIGNVVLSGLKGQTVAKQLNSSPSNPRTVAQTVNRVRMSNAVLAWQFLSLFLANATGLRKPLESVYNAFVRLAKPGMSSTPLGSRVSAAVESLTSGLFVGNWFSIDVVGATASSIHLSLSNAGVEWRSSFRASVILINSVSGEQRVIDIPLMESDYIDNTAKITVPTLSGTDIAAAYVYDSASSKVSNIPFYEL